MTSKSTSAAQLTIPLGVDASWMELAAQEEQRTPANARKELEAAELLSMVTGMAFAQAEEVLRKAGGLHKLAQMPDYALQALPQIGPRRAQQIRAMTDWGLLLSSVAELTGVQIRTPADVANLVMLEMGLLDKEELRVIGLDRRNRIVDSETVYRGSVDSIVLRVAEVLRLPIALQCPAMILLHNHPGGDPSPSPADRQVTELVFDTAQRLSIALLDHLIIGRNRFVSLKEIGVGFG